MGKGIGDSGNQVSDRALALIEEQAEQSIRRVWHDDRWYFSVVDIVGMLTDSASPGAYWRVLKLRLKEQGGDDQVYARVARLRVRAADGKMRYADCADAEALREMRRFVPGAAAWRRKIRSESILYAIGLPDGSMVKIGTTTDLAGRLRGIQNTSPVPVMLIWHAPGDGSLERKLHAQFAHRRAHGEWFSFAGSACDRGTASGDERDHGACRMSSDDPGPTIYADLNAAFHVARYADIPDASWPQIAAWLQQRIAAGQRR